MLSIGSNHPQFSLPTFSLNTPNTFQGDLSLWQNTMFLKPSARKGIPPFCADASSAVIFPLRTFPLCFWGFLPWGFEFCPQWTCDRHIALDRPCPRNSLPVRCCSLLHFTSRGLPHGSTKMCSLFWDYTSARSLWLFKHDMLLAPNPLCVTLGGSSSSPPIAAYTYWNLSGVLKRCLMFLIISNFGYILITGNDPPLPSPSRNLPVL